MKKILPVLFALFFITSSYAQLPYKSGVGVEAAFPTGDFSVGQGFGAHYLGQISLPLIDITGSVGLDKFAEKDNGLVKTSAIMYGVNVGAQLGIFPFVYAGAQLGNYWRTFTVNTPNGKSDASDSQVAITPLVGVHIAIFDVSARYTIMKDSDFFALRAAIFF